MTKLDTEAWIKRGRTLLYVLLVPAWCVVIVYVGGAGWYKADLEHVLETEIDFVGATDEEGSPATVGTCGGFIYDGIRFRTPGAAEKFIKQEKVNAAFPWVVDLPWWTGLLLLGMGASVLGCLVGLLGRKVTRKLPIGELDMFWEPFVAGLMGGVVAILLTAVPAVISGTDSTPRPLVLAAVAIAGGYDIKRLRRWLGGATKKLMPDLTDTDAAKPKNEDDE